MKKLLLSKGKNLNEEQFERFYQKVDVDGDGPCLAATLHYTTWCRAGASRCLASPHRLAARRRACRTMTSQ